MAKSYMVWMNPERFGQISSMLDVLIESKLPKSEKKIASSLKYRMAQYRTNPGERAQVILKPNEAHLLNDITTALGMKGTVAKEISY